MKLYTKSGDDGTTGLFGGDRVSKDHQRVEAYGTVDELNASIGLCIASTASDRPVQNRMAELLKQLQSRLFDLGADLSTPLGNKHESKIHRISETDTASIEGWIDEIDSGNTPMTNFVLPGGTDLAARLHLARTIARRAEREVIRLTHTEEVNSQALIYLNRINDFLFALARRANNDAGIDDVAWTATPDH